MIGMLKKMVWGPWREPCRRPCFASGKSSVALGVENLEDRLTPAVVTHPAALVAVYQPAVAPPPNFALVAQVLPIAIGELNPQPLPPNR
jgi:hypothetical protein